MKRFSPYWFSPKDDAEQAKQTNKRAKEAKRKNVRDERFLKEGGAETRELTVVKHEVALREVSYDEIELLSPGSEEF